MLIYDNFNKIVTKNIDNIDNITKLTLAVIYSNYDSITILAPLVQYNAYPYRCIPDSHNVNWPTILHFILFHADKCKDLQHVEFLTSIVLNMYIGWGDYTIVSFNEDPYLLSLLRYSFKFKNIQLFDCVFNQFVSSDLIKNTHLKIYNNFKNVLVHLFDTEWFNEISLKYPLTTEIYIAYSKIVMFDNPAWQYMTHFYVNTLYEHDSAWFLHTFTDDEREVALGYISYFIRNDIQVDPFDIVCWFGDYNVNQLKYAMREYKIKLTPKLLLSIVPKDANMYYWITSQLEKLLADKIKNKHITKQDFYDQYNARLHINGPSCEKV